MRGMLSELHTWKYLTNKWLEEATSLVLSNEILKYIKARQLFSCKASHNNNVLLCKSPMHSNLFVTKLCL